MVLGKSTSVRKVYYCVRKVYHSVRKVYYGVRKIWTGLVWTGGQGEPGESHQERVINRQPNKQPGEYRAFPDLLNQWF